EIWPILRGHIFGGQLRFTRLIFTLLIAIVIIGTARLLLEPASDSSANEITKVTLPQGMDDVALSQLQQTLDLATAASDRESMIATILQIKALTPPNPSLTKQLVQLYFEQGVTLRNRYKFAEAHTKFVEAVYFKPEWQLAQRELAQVDLYLAGDDAFQKADWPTAISNFTTLYKDKPGYPNVATMLHGAYFNQGTVQKTQGQLQEALALFHAANSILPGTIEAQAEIDAITQQLFPPEEPEPAASVKNVPPKLDGNAPGQKQVVVDISEQRTYAYLGDDLVFDFIVSTGEPGRDTLPGSYEILNKIPVAYAGTWNLDMPYWLGIYWAGHLQNGFHAVPTQRATGVTMWEGYLGQRVSYGCIILSVQDAETLYNWVDVGTSVTIQQ
ncbi:MAG: L,D-transpeptidase family protein, partial [Chloroflexota bacterium]